MSRPKEHDEGFSAFFAGVERDDNPYDKIDGKWHDFSEQGKAWHWLDGWFEAEFADKNMGG